MNPSKSDNNKLIIYTDREGFSQGIVEELIALVPDSSKSESIDWYLGEDTITKDNLEQSLNIGKVDSHRNYKTYRKELDQFISQLFDKQIDYKFSGLKLKSEIYPIIRYRLLFDFEKDFHRYWVLSKLLEKPCGFLLLEFTAKDPNELATLELLKREVEGKHKNVKVRINSPKGLSAKPISLFREWLYQLRISLKENKSKWPKAKKYKTVILENYGNGTKLANSLIDRTGADKSSILFVYTNEAVASKVHSSVDKLFGGEMHIASRFKVLSALGKLRYLKADMPYEFLKRSFSLIIIKTLVELEDLKTNFKKINAEYKPETMLTSNYSGMFSRFWCKLFKGETYNIYGQHGLLVRYSYLNDFCQDELWLWGEKFADYIPKQPNQEIKVIGRIPENHSPSSLRQVDHSKVNILFLASRRGGAVVSESLMGYMLDYLSTETNGQDDTLKLWVRPHPADAGSSWYQDYINSNSAVGAAVEGTADDWVNHCDICIVASSTTVLDVSKKGKLLGLFRNFPNHDAAFEFEKYPEVFFLDTPGDLQKLVNLYRKEATHNAGDLSRDYAEEFKETEIVGQLA